MILEEAQKILSEDYTVIDLIDLSEFDGKDQGYLYQKLFPLSKEKFSDDERIIFYCSQPLIRKFTDLPPKTLIHLQKMLVYSNIPNFFCIIISNEYNIHLDIEYVCNKYAVNEDPIQIILHEAN